MPPSESVPPARRSDATANVVRILETAARLLARDPDAAIGEIATRAGVARSTLYRHFPTRETLIEAVRHRTRDLADRDEPPSLRPPGELANTSSSPLSIPDILNKVPPYHLGQQIVAEAQRLAGVQAAALYLGDLQGRLLRKLAGAPAFPVELDIRGAVGTEIPREAFSGVAASIVERLPGALVVPLTLRGRAIGVLVVVGPGDDALRDLAREAAAALALADDYTDAMQTVRRARDTSPAAEIQQNLLPARLVRIGGATLAGNVLPGYEIGGDWFDFADNEDSAWFGIADVRGSGPKAAGLAAILLGAFRSARRQGEDPAGAAALMHEVLVQIGQPEAVADITVGCWSAPSSLLRWVTCGTPAPVVLGADGSAQELPSLPTSLGDPDLVPPFRVHHRRLEPGERLLLASDGARQCTDAAGSPLGLDGIADAVRQAVGTSAAATVHAIERRVCGHRGDEPLDDDVTLVVLAPHTPLPFAA